jgi:RNA polymerase sigma-70 factor (ECF subfamily)
MTSDEDLMLEFQNGSRDAFEELFARYRQPLYRFFRRRIANDARADDLMQETFLAVIRAKVRYEPRSLVRTYLYGIALKQVLADRRWQARRPVTLLSEQEAATPQSDAPIWIKQALTKLDEMDREILMLREYEELSYAEIAKLLHLPLNTVRSRLFRARLALKTLLAGDVCQ